MFHILKVLKEHTVTGSQLGPVSEHSQEWFSTSELTKRQPLYISGVVLSRGSTGVRQEGLGDAESMLVVVTGKPTTIVTLLTKSR